MLAKAECQSLISWLKHRIREQARSHRWTIFYMGSAQCSVIAIAASN